MRTGRHQIDTVLGHTHSSPAASRARRATDACVFVATAMGILGPSDSTSRPAPRAMGAPDR